MTNRGNIMQTFRKATFADMDLIFRWAIKNDWSIKNKIWKI